MPEIKEGPYAYRTNCRSDLAYAFEWSVQLGKGPASVSAFSGTPPLQELQCSFLMASARCLRAGQAEGDTGAIRASVTSEWTFAASTRAVLESNSRCSLWMYAAQLAWPKG